MEIDIVYLDDDQNFIKELGDKIVEFIKCTGLNPHIRSCGNADEVLNICESNLCDIFVCDLTMNRSESDHLLGLNIIQQVKEKFPHVFVIGITAGDPSYNEINICEHPFDLFMTKRAIFRQSFKSRPNYTERIFNAYKPVPKISIEIEQLNALKDIPENTVKLLTKRLFSSNLPFIEEILPEKILLSPIGAGRSKSIVFKMHEKSTTRTKSPIINTVVKISHLDDFKEEIYRYNKYIKWNLPYNIRVDILATSSSKEYGAIAYSFAHSNKNSAIYVLTDFLSCVDLNKIRIIIDKIFTATNLLWTPINKKYKDGNVTDRYYKIYFGGEDSGYLTAQKEMSRKLREINSHISIEKNEIQFLGHKFPNYFRTLFESSITGSMSIIHGDLNSNNIIVGHDDEIALIDFRDADIGHLFEDIISLEGCVRLYWKRTNKNSPLQEFEECLKIERQLLAGDVADIEENSGWMAIDYIRKKTKERFPQENYKSYYYGLACYCFRLMRLTGLAPVIAIRLLACIIVSIEHFDKYSNN